MATAADVVRIAHQEEIIEQVRPAGGLRVDWAVTVLCTWLIGGVYLDGWAHNHGKVDNTFFTPWHAVLYSGFFAVASFLVLSLLRNRQRGYAWQRAMPVGYEWSVLGVLIFGLGGLGDMVWHILFGIEVDVEATLSPTHLLLATGVVLITAAPLRAAWQRLKPGSKPTWADAAPMILSATFVLSALTFMTQYAHPFVRPRASDLALAAKSQAHTELYQMHADGSGQSRFIVDPQTEHAHPAWSPDGQKLAIATGRNDNALQITLLNADGTNLQPITTGTGSNWSPAWSRTNRIAFTGQHDGNMDIWVMNADGSGQARLTTDPAFDWGARWSPDGQQLAFISNRDGNNEIYVMRADGSQQTRLTENLNNDTDPSWSPDGRLIAFSSARDGNLEIYVMDATGDQPIRLTNNPASDWGPVWSPDGQQLVFVSSRDGNNEIYRMNADGSSPINLTRNPALQEGNRLLAWSPDGSRIAYTVQANVSPVSTRFFNQALGVTSILLQAGILMGLVLFLLRRGSLPFGALAVGFTLNATLLSFMDDQYEMIVVALLAGLVADLLLWRLQTAFHRPPAFRLFAFVVPVVLYSLYFAALRATEGIGWSIHMWMGSIFLAGVVGLLLSFLVTPLTAVLENV